MKAYYVKWEITRFKYEMHHTLDLNELTTIPERLCSFVTVWDIY